MLNELSKRKMIDEIIIEVKKQKQYISKFELQIMSRGYVEHLYRWFVLGEDVGQYDMT